MAQYKPGLHKDVKTIFEGVWDPELDNTEQFDGLNSAADPASRLIQRSKFKAHSNSLEKQWKGLLLMPSRKKGKHNKFLSILRH